MNIDAFSLVFATIFGGGCCGVGVYIAFRGEWGFSFWYLFLAVVNGHTAYSALVNLLGL